MQSVGADAQFDRAEVIDWFREGTDALRVVALNLMFVNPAYRDFPTVVEVIAEPHRLFEQYYGMLLAEMMLDDLNPLERHLLGKAVKRARKKRKVRSDGPLMTTSTRILQQL